MTARTPTSRKKLDEVMDAAGPHAKLRLAKQVRKQARLLIADGQAQLAPAELRELDSAIAELEAALN